MKQTILTITLAALIPMSAIAAGQNPLKVNATELPIPIHASEAIKSFLTVAPAPLNSEVVQNIQLPQTKSEWKQYIEQFDAPGVEQGRKQAEQFNVKFEVSTLEGVEIYTVTPEMVAPKYKNNVFVHIHGGAWIYGGNDSLLREATITAHKLQIPVISINYRKAPEHPAPSAVNDIVTVWSALLKERPANSMMLGGTSAGGNLTAASVHRMKDVGLPTPAALFIGTPAADIQKKTDSRFVNDGVDGGLGTWDVGIEAAVDLYIGNLDPTSPYLSPIYGDFSEFPPTILVSGTRDLMLSDTVLMHRAIRDAGAMADLHIYEAHSHGFYMLPGDDRANFYAEMDAFANTHLVKYEDVVKGEPPHLLLSDFLIPETK